MLDHVCIFSMSGVVLWSKTMAKLKGTPVNDLISSVLLEGKGGSSFITTDWYCLRWTVANDLDFVIVVVHQKMLNLQYVDPLLDRLKKDLLKRYGAEALKGSNPLPYDKPFNKILKEEEAKAKASPKQRSTPDFLLTKKLPDETPEDISPGINSDGDEVPSEGSPEEDMAAARAKLKAKGKRGRGSKGQLEAGAAALSASNSSVSSEKKTKKGTVWNDGSGKGKMSKKQKEALDRSKKGQPEPEDGDSALLQEMKATYLPEEGETADWEDEDDSDFDLGDDDEVCSPNKQTIAQLFSKTAIGGLLAGITGNKVLTSADLEQPLEKVKMQLVSKNVASEITEEICASVHASLTDTKLASFTRVSSAIHQALKESMTRVLTPKKSTDLLRAVQASSSRGRPYAVVFVGINGVGKSTSLAKVAYYLKQHGVKVLIAACDTFRSGAVEQLRVHAKCLDVPLFEMGYARDPAVVATAALKQGADEGYDCVLIDTAGRMQNNEPLMRALSKLITDNSPDQTLFVGEALVGNDGIDQLRMFNRALANYSPPGTIHQIDGIVLTKFDTIDTKVGAALSMTYQTGQPVVFVGTGQKYTHLRKLNVGYVIKALFS
ncbi:unnamed protein product [Chrysoparadoxa australica]